MLLPRFLLIILILSILNTQAYMIGTGSYLNCSDEFLMKTSKMIYEGRLTTESLKRISEEACFSTDREVRSPLVIRTGPVEAYRMALVRLLNETFSVADVEAVYNDSSNMLFAMLENSSSVDSSLLFIFCPDVSINSSGLSVCGHTYPNLMVKHSTNRTSFYISSTTDGVQINGLLNTAWVRLNKNDVVTEHGVLFYSPDDAFYLLPKDVSIVSIRLIDGPLYSITVSEDRRLFGIIRLTVEYETTVDPQTLELSVQRPWWYLLTF